MRRLAISLQQISARDNLLLATSKAARGKQARPEIARWLAKLESNIAHLSQAILNGSAPDGRMRRFTIRDPKVRQISAACFADRVLHHALLNLTEQRFEQALVGSSYACRAGKGVHAASAAVQGALRRFAWWVQVDVAAYFDSIDHGRLKALLSTRFKGEALSLMGRIIDRGGSGGVGLPIGALTSQHFANAYLDGADRWLLAHGAVRAHVRYMDDTVWWCESREAAVDVLRAYIVWLCAERDLSLKPNVRMGASERGLQFCGFRVKPGIVLPSARKLARYREQAERLGRAQAGGMPIAILQRAHDVMASTLAHTQSARFRRRVSAGVLAYSEPL